MIEQITDESTLRNRHVVPQEGLIIDDANKGIQRTVSGRWINLDRVADTRRLVADSTSIVLIIGQIANFDLLGVTDLIEEFDVIIASQNDGQAITIPVERWRAYLKEYPNQQNFSYWQGAVYNGSNATPKTIQAYVNRTVPNRLRLRPFLGSITITRIIGIKYRYGFFIP